MASIETILSAMRSQPKNVRYADLHKACKHYFGLPRSSGGSHAVFRTPWPGDPRVNIQNDHGKAKPYRCASARRDREEGGQVMQTKPTTEISHYTYRVTWSVEDQEFVATCLEFPSLSWLAETQVQALSGLEKVIADAIEDLSSAGEPVPDPLSERSFSGKFNLRVGEALHRRLAMEAAEEKLSINQLIVRRLSSAS